MHVDAIPLRLMIGGFRVIAVDERDEMVEVVIETLPPEACCPHCGHADAAAKERKQLVVRDVPLRPGKQTWLIWWKRRFACVRCSKTFTETCREIPARATHTNRFDDYLSARAIETPYAQVAEEEGVSFHRVDKASRARAERLEAGRTLDPPTRLNIDEQSHLRGQVYNTAVSDPDRKRVLELIETRKTGAPAGLPGFSARRHQGLDPRGVHRHAPTLPGCDPLRFAACRHRVRPLPRRAHGRRCGR